MPGCSEVRDHPGGPPLLVRCLESPIGQHAVCSGLAPQNLDMGGNQNGALDNCGVKNFSGAGVQVTQTGCREDDATDVP